VSSTRVLDFLFIVRGMKEMPSKTALAANLRRLMDKEQLSEAQAAKKTGVSQKGINKILNESTSATIDIIERLAQGFNIPTWLIITPNMDSEEQSLLESYRNSSESAKHIFRGVAQASTPYVDEEKHAQNK